MISYFVFVQLSSTKENISDSMSHAKIEGKLNAKHFQANIRVAEVIVKLLQLPADKIGANMMELDAALNDVVENVTS